jgi:hypothetical protein
LHQGKLHRSGAALLEVSIAPGKMGELGVEGNAHDLCMALLELRNPPVMGDDYRIAQLGINAVAMNPLVRDELARLVREVLDTDGD